MANEYNQQLMAEQVRRIRATVANSLHAKEAGNNGLVPLSEFNEVLKEMKISLTNEDKAFLEKKSGSHNLIPYQKILKRLKLCSNRGVNIWYIQKEGQVDSQFMYGQIRKTSASPDNVLAYTNKSPVYQSPGKGSRINRISDVIIKLQKAKLDDRALGVIKTKADKLKQQVIPLQKFKKILNDISYDLPEAAKQEIINYSSDSDGNILLTKFNELFKKYKFIPVKSIAYDHQRNSPNMSAALTQVSPVFKNGKLIFNNSDEFGKSSQKSILRVLPHLEKPEHEYGKRKHQSPNMREVLSQTFKKPMDGSLSPSHSSFKRGLGLIGELSLGRKGHR